MKYTDTHTEQNTTSDCSTAYVTYTTLSSIRETQGANSRIFVRKTMQMGSSWVGGALGVWCCLGDALILGTRTRTRW